MKFAVVMKVGLNDSFNIGYQVLNNIIVGIIIDSK